MEHNFFTLCLNFFIKNDYIRSVENRKLERGDESPLFFYKKMIQKKRIIELAQERIDELDNGCYLVDVSVSTKNAIFVKMDNLNHGVSIKDCISVSRNIEHNLDREVQDFELKVSSPGLDQPFMVHEQYLKNIGKTVELVTKSLSLKGELTKVSSEEVELKQIDTVKNKTTKKKETIETIHNIKMNEIKETRLVISF